MSRLVNLLHKLPTLLILFSLLLVNKHLRSLYSLELCLHSNVLFNQLQLLEVFQLFIDVVVFLLLLPFQIRPFLPSNGLFT